MQKTGKHHGWSAELRSWYCFMWRRFIQLAILIGRSGGCYGGQLFFGIIFLVLPIMFCLFSYCYENFRYRPQLIEAAHTFSGFP
ncbi:MAG: hypothetical protein RR060_06765, partial [Victivallaceae bacterium]